MIECVLGRKEKVCACVIHPPVWVLADTTDVIHWGFFFTLAARTEKTTWGGRGVVSVRVWF